jgi:hypothetical protein
MRGRKPLAKVARISAPIAGWNAKSPLSEMEPTEAIRLDNWIADQEGVSLRNGFTSWCTGLGNPVESLMEFAPASGGNELWAAADGNIYDVTAGGTVGTAVVTGQSNDRLYHTMFSTGSGQPYLIAANGQDDYLAYDGSTWTTPTITGATSSSLIYPMAHVSRLFFIEDGTLSFWYGATAAIAGAFVEFDLSPLCKLGGELVSMATWSRDGGAGPDDYAVFITSKGELLIYQGTDPGDSNAWGKVGTFKVGEPIGRKCFLNAGSDLGVLTSEGILPLSQMIGLTQGTSARISATDKISTAFRDAYQGGATNFGWQMLEHSKTRLLFVNVPLIERATTRQYVMNTQNGAWSRFTGMDGGCMSLLGDDLFVGGVDGTVYKYDLDKWDDDGEAITAVYQSAYIDGGRAENKRFTMARPLFQGPPGFNPKVQVKTNYDITPPTTQTVAASDLGSVWDVSEWDDADWGLDTIALSRWQTVKGIGSTVSVAFTLTSNSPLMFNEIDLMYEIGGYL